MSCIWTSGRHLIVCFMGNLVKIDKMGRSVKLSSHVGIRHNWTDCSQTGKYWVRGGIIMWIPPGSAEPDLIEDQGSPCKLLPYTLTGICHSLPCLPTSWHWCGVQWWYALGMCQAGSGVPWRESRSGSHGDRSAGRRGMVGSRNDVGLVLLSSSPQHFWSRRATEIWWNLTFLEPMEGKRCSLLQEEENLCEEA